jgi:hypothetical protein
MAVVQLGEVITGDPKLLWWFPWPIIFKPKKKIKLPMEYEIVTQRVLVHIESILQKTKNLNITHEV